MMSDAAVEMASQGVSAVVVLGVDFMAENVRAVLDASGHDSVPVYRVSPSAIGCSLAEAAETDAYESWLEEAARVPRSLHVVYINTSLQTKATAHRLIPTITCTSSNVLQTVLQAAAQIEDLHVWFGPDTYMGANLTQLLGSLAGMSEEEVRGVHSKHSQRSIRELLSRFEYFRRGVCVVHHMFGDQVAETVRAEHPGRVCYRATWKCRGRCLTSPSRHSATGGGWSVRRRTSCRSSRRRWLAGHPSHGDRLSFVLGTEAGMITSIVREVREQLQNESAPPEVEIVFPVASDAVTATDDPELALVPGVASGEGWLGRGGCATCPFMKMNSLDALFRTISRIGNETSDRLTQFGAEEIRDAPRRPQHR